MASLVDTSVWIEFFHDEHTARVERLEEIVGRGEAILGDLILCEVLQGIHDQRDFVTVKSHLDAFPVYAMVGKHIAVQSAINYRLLRHKGFTVRKTIDCVIATFCIENGLMLLHNDRDFDPFERELGLKIVR